MVAAGPRSPQLHNRAHPNVEPVPDEVWRRIYSRKDEVDECAGDDLKAIQSQSEPQ